ncbi:hypothetical protein CALVIDRAFT_510353 [Calocera viscosa TUFC12733]|uniref:ARM repeat-containing protein n=1 Tax=Calocera viscosa (strain TUFC12733) TaxID=1330018 RepID=A0A167QVS7_CALVF|nr:hypothetical protein CALVIDRAFT_510353 [Calocera viscosa TUFC12733]
MPIIEEIVDDSTTEDVDPFEAAIQPLSKDLPIPSEFLSDGAASDPAKQAQLKQWKFSAEMHLHHLQQYLRTKPELSLEQRARVVITAGVFRGEDSYSTSVMHMSAMSSVKLVIMPNLKAGERYGYAPSALLELVLKEHIKPLFQATPHPQINLDSGRKLPHQAGGNAAAQDFYEDQTWKTKGLGCWNVLTWCVEHMLPESFQDMWPLLVPPIMTLMDDWEATFRIKGILVVDELLKQTDGQLLKRTGVDKLLFASLENSFSQLHTPQTPQLLFDAIRCYTVLTTRVTAPESEERFNRLSDGISKGVLNAWSYAGSDVATMQSAAEGLALLVTELGIGSVRFLKAIIPQLSDNLYTKPFVPPARALQLSTAECLRVVIHECALTITEWKERILHGLLKAWVEVNRIVNKDQDTLAVQTALKEVWGELLLACPTIPQVETPQLHTLDTNMFQALIAA